MDLEGRLFENLERVTADEYERLITPDPNNPAHKDLTTLAEGHIGYIDVADEGKDYTAAIVGAIVKNKVYIVDYVFTRDNTDIAIPLAAAMLDKYNVSYCRVESNNMGAMFGRTLNKMIKGKVLAVHNQQNKITRIIMQSAFVLNNFIWVERSGPQYIQFIENLESFSKEGKNKNDDAPDATAGLSMFVQAMFKTNF